MLRGARSNPALRRANGTRDLLQLVVSSPFLRQHVYQQTSGDEWHAIAAAFLAAAGSLPQPFAIVESGNLCGATTIWLALLKRAFCPACPFYSVDPGLYRRRVGQPLSCARDSLEWAGLRDEA